MTEETFLAEALSTVVCGLRSIDLHLAKPRLRSAINSFSFIVARPLGMTALCHPEERSDVRISFFRPSVALLLGLLVRFLLTSFVRNDIVSAINSLSFIVARTIRNDRSYLLIMVRFISNDRSG